MWPLHTPGTGDQDPSIKHNKKNVEAMERLKVSVTKAINIEKV